jgi:hypothetical protein
MKETPLVSISLHGGYLLQLYQRDRELTVELWSKAHQNGKQWQLVSTTALSTEEAEELVNPLVRYWASLHKRVPAQEA